MPTITMTQQRDRMNNMMMMHPANRQLGGLPDEDDTVYDNYIETTIDPGNTLLLIAVFVCLASLLGLPLYIKLGRCLTRSKKDDDVGDTGSEIQNDDDIGSNDGDEQLVEHSGNATPASQPQRQPTSTENQSFLQRIRTSSYSAVLFVLNGAVRWRKRGGHHEGNMDWRKEHVARGMAREAEQSMYMHHREDVAAEAAAAAAATRSMSHDDDDDDANLLHTHESTEQVEPGLDGSFVEIVRTPDQQQQDKEGKAKTPLLAIQSEFDQRNDQIELRDATTTTSSSSATPYTYLRKRTSFLWTVIKYDNETMRILRLAIPFTFSACADTIASLIELAIISQFLGTDAMVAFAMVDIVTGISSEFMGGWVEAISSLGSMAYGAENYELLGQYVQTSCIGFVLCEIPFAFIWGATIDKILILMGFEESVAMLAKDYVLVAVANNMMMGINEAVLDFLEVVEKEMYANVMYCLNSIMEVGLVALFAIKMDAGLVILGLVMLTNQAFFFFLNVLIPNKMGWLTNFELGLFGQLSLRNTPMIKELFEVALPLAVGNLLAYAEWEILTVFAAILGPAEAATWAILGFVWDVFESTTEAIGDASEVRCAYQLGKGRPALAKLSAYKSMFMAMIMALSVTTVFLSMRDYLPGWLTADETIQGMLVELFPLVAMGNITMNMGMVCWALVGAQGRYRLATSVATACSLLITIPIGAICTVWLRVNLQGLTFAVVMGYSVTAALLSTVLFLSDWEGFASKIQARMLADMDSDSDSDDDSSSSSESEKDFETGQGSQHPPTVPSYFEVSPGTPGSFVPPPPSPTSLPNEPRCVVGVKHQKYQTGSLAATSPPRSPTRKLQLGMGSSLTPDSRSSPRTPTRRQRPGHRPMTPDQKQAKSLARLRSLSSQHTGILLPSPPNSPRSSAAPNSPRSPDSPNTPGLNTTPGGLGYETSVLAFSSARSCPVYSDGQPLPTRVVKGRRRRIH